MKRTKARALAQRKRENGQTFEIGERWSFCITSAQKDCMYIGKVMEEKIGVKQATKQGYIPMNVGGVVDLSYPTSEFRRGRVQGGGDVSPTLTTEIWICKVVGKGQIKLANVEDYLYKGFGVFKLSPRECCRLMGVKDSDSTKMLEVNSKTQVYKQAGNSIAVPVLMALFSQLGLPGVKKWNDMSEEERKALVAENMDFLKGGE